MEIRLIVIATITVCGLGFYACKRYAGTRERRLKERQYETAVKLTEFARDLLEEMGETARLETVVLDFRKIIVPRCKGYRVLIELMGYRFRIHALPERYGGSGRLSFLIDESLILRAADQGGNRASDEDEQYTGDFNA